MGPAEFKEDYSAHDVSDGGLRTALVEMALPRGLGFHVVIDSDIRPEGFLFGEAQGSAVITVIDESYLPLPRFDAGQQGPLPPPGHVTKGKLMVDDESFGFVVMRGKCPRTCCRR